MAFGNNFAVRNILQEMSTPPLSSRLVDSEVNRTSIPDSFLTPSPEEQIIRQRSRLPLVENNDDENETPNKGMFLNQQGRKRLLMSPPCASPIKSKSKRCRLLNKKLPPLKTELSAYTTEQLVSIIDKLVQNYPDLEQDIRSTLPLPDLKPLEDRLNELQRNIYKAFPNTRWGSSRDSFCFKRVKVHLEAFKKTCIEQGKTLQSAQCWEASVRYVIIAWKFTSQLPSWDDEAHNKSKELCFKALAAQCLQALKKGQFDKEVCRELRRKLEMASQQSAVIEPCIKECDKLLLQ